MSQDNLNSGDQPQEPAVASQPHHGFTNAVVRIFLRSNLALILILLAAALGVSSLIVTPREEDPQIIVPLADVHVGFPGHSAQEVEQLVAVPLERLLYQIDGVEYVYSMAREDQAVITVRFYVGEDRERSLVKIFKKIDENVDIVPAGVTGWVVKPVEIDDVPIVTLTLAGKSRNAETCKRRNAEGGGDGTGTVDEFALRRVAEELVERLAAVTDVSRAYVVGGQPRVIYARLDPDRMQAYRVSPLEIQRAAGATNITRTAGEFTRRDEVFRVQAGKAFARPEEVKELVVAVFEDRPVFLKDVATIIDGPEEASSYVRHGWGPARGFDDNPNAAGSTIGASGSRSEISNLRSEISSPAVTIAISKKKGSNAVSVANEIVAAARSLTSDIVPDDMDLVITRNAGLTSNEKVNELVEALAVAIFIVIALLTIGLGWRESLIVAVAVPVVFGLTLTVNLLFGYTINRVTLFALILSLGLLVDDPIVDVENIARHFVIRGRATREIVLEAVAEIRPPLITATLAVMVSFLPMFFITGMMGPYMRPMALNVPVAMLMSMVVAFTITPWLAYHVLRKRYGHQPSAVSHQPEGPGDLKQTFLYRLFYPLMAPLLHSRKKAWAFLLIMGGLTLGAALLAATRHVPLKMLPFDNKNELLLVLDFDEGTTLERSDAAVRDFEQYLRQVPEVTDYTSYVGVASPMDFNGMVRHYYLRRGPNVAEVRVNLVGKKSRPQQSHAIGLRLRNDLTTIACKHAAKLKIVETPPGPPVLSSIVAEVYGRPDHTYNDLIDASKVVRARLAVEPGVVDVDDTVEAAERKLVFVTDKEKAAISGVSVSDIADTIAIALGGETAGTVRAAGERNPMRIELQLPRNIRSSVEDLSRLYIKGRSGSMVALAELGKWEDARVGQTIYHKNLQPVVYIFAETAGRPPAECVVDVMNNRDWGNAKPDGRSADGQEYSYGAVEHVGSGWIDNRGVKPIEDRSFLDNGGWVGWHVPAGIRVDFAGEGEWKITLDVFRDLGLAFGAALIAIYILLVSQTGSFVIPLVVMLAIPLTILGIMPGFWLLNAISGGQVGPYADPIFFTATGMIGMIALAGIVTRDSIILVDFIHLSLARGLSLFDAIMESRVVRLRPILLTAATAMLSAAPIAIDPIFSGLAWSLIFGLLASTAFTLFVIPIAYWLLYANKPGHGLAGAQE
jgi:multidrug efflux pump subunit AcrB